MNEITAFSYNKNKKGPTPEKVVQLPQLPLDLHLQKIKVLGMLYCKTKS